MLFGSERVMKQSLWESLADTTNAEEAMHWSFYCAAGKHHTFLDGFLALKKIADTFEKKYNAASSK